MPGPESVLTKRVPSLREWLGDEPDGEGFEEWVALALGKQVENLPPDEARCLRIMNTFAIACVEQMNREVAIDASPQGISDAMALWARPAGYTMMTAIASVSRDDAPFRRLAKVFTEEFKIGAKMAADSLIAAEAGHG